MNKPRLSWTRLQHSLVLAMATTLFLLAILAVINAPCSTLPIDYRSFDLNDTIINSDSSVDNIDLDLVKQESNGDLESSESSFISASSTRSRSAGSTGSTTRSRTTSSTRTTSTRMSSGRGRTSSTRRSSGSSSDKKIMAKSKLGSMDMLESVLMLGKLASGSDAEFARDLRFGVKYVKHEFEKYEPYLNLVKGALHLALDKN